MTCNGHNHSKDCRCNFRGGHPNSHIPRWRGWGRSSIRAYLKAPNAKCPECRAQIYYIPGAKGGGAYFECLGPPWTKHPCTKRPRAYSPYNAKGQPKLRNRRSTFERDGWIPFIIRNVEQLVAGTIINGAVLENPAKLHLGLPQSIKPDKTRPAFLKYPDTKTYIELNCFEENANEPTSHKAFNDCRNEFELLLKSKG